MYLLNKLWVVSATRFMAAFLYGVTLLFFIKDVWNIRWKFDRVLWKSMLQYALPLVAVSFAAMVCQMIDKTMLKYFLPYSEKENLAQLGIYGAGTRLAMHGLV